MGDVCRARLCVVYLVHLDTKEETARRTPKLATGPPTADLPKEEANMIHVHIRDRACTPPHDRNAGFAHVSSNMCGSDSD